jgi:dipeptidyl aminopeptidase/acylaminoacyl peptidase
MADWAVGRLIWVVMAVCLAAAGGCTPTAHLSWSPDGAHGAYFVPTAGKLLPGVGYLIDAGGKITGRLGPTFGSFAWSADSQTVYFGGYDNTPPANDMAERDWLVDPQQPPPPITDAPEKEYPPMVLCAWHDGQMARLVSLGNRYVVFVQLSPDQNWLAVTAAARDHGDQWRFELFVCNVASKKLHVISESCGMGACFSGPSRLAYCERASGAIVEMELNESADHLDRTPVVDVLTDRTDCLAAVSDGMLFTTSARAFPAVSSKAAADRPPSLYRFSSGDGKLKMLAESTGQLFSISPDGKRVLYISDTPGVDESPDKRELAVMDIDGSNPHVLMDISRYGSQPPMWPTWHGNDRITFVSAGGKDLPGKADEDPRLAFDVVDYHVTAANLLEPAITLSTDWPAEMKPAMRKADFQPPVPPPP